MLISKQIPLCIVFETIKIEISAIENVSVKKVDKLPDKFHGFVPDILLLPVVYRKPKYSAETEYFYYSAFGFGHQNFILDFRPSVLS